jgi:hypothetical protein
MTPHDMQDKKPSWYDRRIFAVTTEREREGVLYFQRVFGLPETGELDNGTVSHIRGLQAMMGLRTSGIIDDATAIEIERIFPEGA